MLAEERLSWFKRKALLWLVMVVMLTCGYSMHRYLEAEGIEKTFRFKQEDIAAAVPVTNSQQVRV